MEQKQQQEMTELQKAKEELQKAKEELEKAKEEHKEHTDRLKNLQEMQGIIDSLFNSYNTNSNNKIVEFSAFWEEKLTEKNKKEDYDEYLKNGGETKLKEERIKNGDKRKKVLILEKKMNCYDKIVEKQNKLSYYL